MSKYVAIGDIHGCLVELEKMLTTLDEQFPDHLRIFLGDYIDRGPDSKGVIDRLIEYSKERECVFLRGNHEDMFMEALSQGLMWHYQDYPETYKSYGLDYTTIGYEHIPMSHLKFLKETRQYFETDKHFFVHAGVNPSYGFKEQTWQDSLWIRDKFLTFLGDFGKVVVHGHTPQDKITWKKNRVNIDTSCVFGGCLTAIIIDEDLELMRYTPEQVKSEYNWLDRWR